MILNILLFSFLFDWYYKMVSLQNGDTRGGPPPFSDATEPAAEFLCREPGAIAYIALPPLRLVQFL